MSAQEKTEKATPKRREEARKKGQVAKSADLNGSVVMLAGLGVLAIFGATMAGAMAEFMRESLRMVGTPSEVGGQGLDGLAAKSGTAFLIAIGPVALVCGLAALAINVAQVKFRITPQAMKPDFKRLNPLKGAKNIFGPRMGVEILKTILKAGAIGLIVGMALLPELDSLGALVGMPPGLLAEKLITTILAIAWKAGAVFLVLGAADYGYQRYQHEKSLKMDFQEVKEEFKQQSVNAEVRAAQRQRRQQMARARMMEAVPTADVIVTNPTHYAVALKYEAGKAAPEVVAKGVDLIAAKIREIAKEAGVPIVPDPPLARSLHASVEVGHTIPEELYQAVAGVLAFVYRLAGRQRAAA